MNKNNKNSITNNKNLKPKSTFEELKKLIIWLPYKTNSVELVKRNR